MPHANASATVDATGPGLHGEELLAAYLVRLHATGRGNVSYEWAARRFLRRWPDPQAWAALPLEDRLAEYQSTRPLITFLMLHHGLRPGYDYLLERKLSSVWREIDGSPLQGDVERFMNAAERLGFAVRVRLSTGSQVPVRLLIQTGRRIEDLVQDDLDEFAAACHERTRRTGKSHHHYLSALSNAHTVLFHLGVLGSLPRSGGPVPLPERLAQVTAPIRAEMIAYLERKKATCHAKTVSAMATRLKHFGVFLSTIDPGLSTVRDLDRRRHIEPWLASLLGVVSEKDGQPISIGDRNRRVLAVTTFLTDITEWGWNAAPPRRVIFRDDVPKLPQVLPRYLPVDADRRLTAAGPSTPTTNSPRWRCACNGPAGCGSASCSTSSWTACTRSRATAPG